MNLNGYNFDDLLECLTGATAGILTLMFFFIGENTREIVISPKVGFVLMLIYLVLVYIAIKHYFTRTSTIITHMAIDIGICTVLSVIMALIFGIVTKETITSFNLFGSIPLILTMTISIPAIIFDVKETKSFFVGLGYADSTPKVDISKVSSAVSYCKSRIDDMQECIEKQLKG